MDDDDDDDGDDDDGDDGVVVAAATGGSSGGSSRPTTTSSTAIVVAIVIVIRVSQLCRYAGCVRVDLLFFPFGGKDQHTGISTCGPKLACRRPGTKYCVDLFFYFRTLWNPPPLMLFMQPNDPNILVQYHFRTGPHGVSKRRGEGLAVTLLMAVLRLQKRPIAVRGCTDRRERRGGRERDLRINGEAIIESAYAYAPIMAG